MSLSAELDKKLNEYTKEELILGIKEIDYKGYILTKLPLIKYNRICREAEKIAKKAKEYADKKQYSLSNQYYDKSFELYEKADKFISKAKK